MSVSNYIEPFEMETPLSINNDNNLEEINESPEGEENSNDNIIFQENHSFDIGKKSNSKAYCGIKGDSEFSCILNIAASAIGGGCFNFPYIVHEGGIVISFIIFLFTSICIYYTVDLLRSFVVETKYFSFALMTEEILGPKWLKTYALCSFSIYTSMEVGYLSSIYLYIQEIYDFNGVLSKIIYFLISMIIEIIICLYITKIAKMHLLSIISIFCFIIMLMSLIVFSILANCKKEVIDKFTSHNLFFPNLSPDNFINKLFKISSYLMIYTYGYSYHSTFPTLIGSLKNVTHSNTKKVHLISFGIICMTYLLISIFGFLLTQDVPIEIFQKDKELFNDAWANLRKPFKYSLIVFLLFLLPIRFIVLRDNYITLIGEKKMTFFKELPIVTLFVIICNILVFCVSEFNAHVEKLEIKTLIQAFGGMFGVIISFCLPVVNYVAVNGKRKIKSIIGYIILGIFVIIGILSTGHTFYQIFVRDE